MGSSRSDIAPRARELEETYTAADLATLLAAREQVVEEWMARARRAETALRSIASGTWTAVGAINCARKALARDGR